MKRIMAFALAFIMCISSLGVIAHAVDAGTMPLAISINEGSDNTITVTVTASEDFSFATLVANVAYDETVFTRNGNGTYNSSYDMGYDSSTDGFMMSAKNTTDEPYMDDVASGTVLATYEFSYADDAANGEYEFTLTVTTFEDGDFASLMPSNPTATATYTVGSTTVDGYTATLSTTSSNNEVVSEGSINVNVAVSHSSDTVFNAGEIKLTYDSTKLTPNTTSLDAMVSAGTLSGYKVNNNELVIEYFGGDKTMPYTYAIPFTAAEVSTQTTDTVTLTRAAFIHKNNASSSDLIEATKSPESLTVTIKVAMVNVTLTNSADSTETTTTTTQKGVAYTFTPADTANYTYSDVTATVGGQEVEVKDNGNGTFTIAGENVTGDIAITYTKSPNNYIVHWDGDGAGDITDKPTTATYGQTLTVTLPADKAPGTEAGYTYGISAKIGENSVGTYDSDTRTLTINGTDITGDITIIVTKTTQSATDVTITVAGDSALSIKDATGNTTTVAIGGSVTLVLTEEVGYDYKVVDSNGDEVTFTNGEYTFTASTSETYTATKTLDVSSVKVTEYVKVDSYVVYLVTYDGTLADNKAPTYDGNFMFWSDSYDAYCWLVIDSTLTVDTAKEKINAQSGTATKVDYGMDINGTGTTDAADAQLVWNMYNALYSDFTTVNMAQFLAADQNATSDDNWGLNVQDAQVIITAILAGNATT